MDFCTTTTHSMDNIPYSPTSLSLEDLINAPAKAESLLELLTPDQISAIERTLGKVKRRRLNKAAEMNKSFSPLVNPKNNASTNTSNASASATTNSTTTISSSSSPSTPPPVLKHVSTNNSSSPNEPITEVKDGVEWVSFVYSHNRTLKRYSIRTDINSVDPSLVCDKFKSENCVYPRANLPKEEYHGNRWAYETECNNLGWKLAWLNKEEIAGKRGLIQRAVDSYRNRYPSMRSRRVARQEKLLNGTLRKRKHRENDEPSSFDSSDMASSLSGVTIQSSHHPKTIAIEDANHQRFRIKINVESVDLEEINIEFRKANCPFPRVMNIPRPAVNNARWLEETMCNELAWKLAWLNPRHLAGKKNMLQRALDIYRSKFMPSLLPRKNSNRVAPIPPPSLTDTVNPQASLMDLLPSTNTLNNIANASSTATHVDAIPSPTETSPASPLTAVMNPTITVSTGIPLTADALSAQNALFEKMNPTVASPAMSNMSGTTESLDFADCFSLADEDTKEDSTSSVDAAAAAIFCDMLLQEPMSLFSVNKEDSSNNLNHNSCRNSTSSYSSDSTACTPSPTMPADPFTVDLFEQFMLPTDNPFYSMMDHNATVSDLSKLYNTTIEDNLATAANLLDPLF
ncbi:uncharacterized protein BX663DRAFT_510610 [Cokeromyces recurvatus]|uniref:uncharacterized protein n=1 Tax=Cokeromyces recurvatus TaxID=90255 RepID=UPI002220E643|nr:uncharacterized protein BX663DRAFT_510610 [Cokeromyces recurvatus]KAI7902820.1 hypothetical protein BX663DRAFT_510610 [Cokeromyces recurvatus]